MKRFLSFLLAILLCFSLMGCKEEDKVHTTTRPKQEQQKQEEKSQITPLLYKVTDGEERTVWLFGSIHVGQESFYPLPDYVLNAFESADVLAVEADIIAFEKDLAAQMQALSLLVYADGTTIRDHISEELYQRAAEILEEAGYYNEALDYYYPALWSSFVDSCLYESIGVDANLGIDRHLLKKAKKADMPIEQIESAEFQYGMLAGFSEPLQVYMLESSVEQAKSKTLTRIGLVQLMNLWASGDEQGFTDYLAQTEQVDEQEAELYQEYYDAMFTKRNESMTDYAEEALFSGETVFICVGAAHVVGSGAIADLLAQRGYTVELVQE